MENSYILILEIDTWIYTNVKICPAVHLRFVNLTICKLHVNKKVKRVSGMEFYI